MKKSSVEIGWLDSLQTLVTAYEEIAANRMQKIRHQVLTNREFMDELNDVFIKVKFSYKTALSRSKLSRLSRKNGRKALVFVAANTGLYGDLVSRIFKQLKEDYQTSDEVVIIGHLGRTMAEGTNFKASFTYFDFPDAMVDLPAVKKICDYLNQFEEVIVYYGLFKNLITQEAVGKNITGEGAVSPPVPTGKPRQALFEPSLLEVLDYFETEVFASLLLHALYESQLSKFSARISILTQTEENIVKALKISYFERERERHQERNRKQLNMLANLRALE